MSKPDSDVKTITKNILDSELSSDVNVYKARDDSGSGGAKVQQNINQNSPSVQIENAETESVEYADTTMSSINLSNSVFITIKDPTQEVSELKEMVKGAFLLNRNRHKNLAGDWDKVLIDDITPSAENVDFTKDKSTLVLTYVSASRTISESDYTNNKYNG